MAVRTGPDETACLSSGLSCTLISKKNIKSPKIVKLDTIYTY